MNAEMAAAIVGAAIAALVAVVLFVIERSVARYSAFVERRRVAFDEVLLSYSAFVAASFSAGGKPTPEFGAQILSSRARMSLALRKDDRVISWWLIGMEKRLGQAASGLPGEEAISRIEQVSTNVTNTLLDIHLGVLNKWDMIVPAAVYFAEYSASALPEEYEPAARVAERPRPHPRNHGIRAVPRNVWNWIARPFRRSRPESWAPDWAKMANA